MTKATDVLSATSYRLAIDSPDTFDVREFSIFDAVNALFGVELIVRCKNPAVDLDAIVGAEASFHIATSDAVYPGMDHPSWSGVVSDIEQLVAEEGGLSTYRISLAPRFWLLTQRTNCRVYQQMTDLEIVTSLLGEWGLAHESRCGETYKTRKYRVQYQETDFAFVSRLLEDSGISYVLQQRGDKTVIVLDDAPHAAKPRSSPLRHVNERALDHLYATAFRAGRRVRSGKSTFADHDPRLPNQPLLGSARSSNHPLESKLEAFAYVPGRFKFGAAGTNETPTADDRGRSRTDPDEARRLAERDAAVRLAQSRRYEFRTNCLEVRAGTVLALENHPIAEALKGLLVTGISISGGTTSETSIEAHAVSAEHAYRPASVTPRPSISGVECATVVGPAGETVHCDEFGRVRVQFHWDRYGAMNEQSSCWVPVNQPWAGEGFGMVNLPRVGQEMLVSFLGGNPEEPVIVGRVFTNLQRPPFQLPKAKHESGFRSKSIPDTGGFNLLRFVDTAGSELVEGRAEKDMQTRVNNDKALSVGRDRSMQIQRDDEETVAGVQRESVGKDKLTRVLDSFLSIVGKDRLMKTIGDVVSFARSHSIVGDDVISHAVGNSYIYMDRDKIILKADTVLVNPDTSK